MNLRRLCGPVFIAAGLNHFVNPKLYEAIVPRYLPAAEDLVFASGIAELGGGIGLMVPHARTRRNAERFLIATLIAVFPANLEMALHPERFPKIPGGKAALYARLPLQIAFIAWVRAAAADPDGLKD